MVVVVLLLPLLEPPQACGCVGWCLPNDLTVLQPSTVTVWLPRLHHELPSIHHHHHHPSIPQPHHPRPQRSGIEHIDQFLWKRFTTFSL